MDFSFLFESVSHFTASAGIFISGALASPLFKLGTRVFATLGHFASIATWLDSHPRAAKGLLIGIIVVVCLISVGCAQPRFDQREHGEGVEEQRGLYGGDYCKRIRDEFYISVHKYKQCKGGLFSAILDFEKIADIENNEQSAAVDKIVEDKPCYAERIVMSNSKKSFDNCSNSYKRGKFFVNPTYKYVIPEI